MLTPEELARREEVEKVRAERSLEQAERVDLALTLLRTILETKKVTQLEVAARVGVHNATVSFWAAGRWRPSGDKLERLERSLAELGAAGSRKLKRTRSAERARIMSALRTAVACGGSDEVVAGLARLLVGKRSSGRRRKTA